MRYEAVLLRCTLATRQDERQYGFQPDATGNLSIGGRASSSYCAFVVRDSQSHVAYVRFHNCCRTAMWMKMCSWCLFFSALRKTKSDEQVPSPDIVVRPRRIIF